MRRHTIITRYPESADSAGIKALRVMGLARTVDGNIWRLYESSAARASSKKETRARRGFVILYKIYNFDFPPRSWRIQASTSVQATSPNGLKKFPYSAAFALLACRTADLAAIPCIMILPR